MVEDPKQKKTQQPQQVEQPASQPKNRDPEDSTDTVAKPGQRDRMPEEREVRDTSKNAGKPQPGSDQKRVDAGAAKADHEVDGSE